MRGYIFFFRNEIFFKKTTSLASSLNLRHHCLCTGEIFQCSWCDHENTRADTFTSTLWHVITSWPPQPHVFTLFLPLKFHATHHNHEQRIPTKQLNRKKLETRYIHHNQITVGLQRNGSQHKAKILISSIQIFTLKSSNYEIYPSENQKDPISWFCLMRAPFFVQAWCRPASRVTS